MKKELVKSLNGYIANLGVAYLKVHNFHWNVTGPDFKDVHEYLETIYDAYAASMDEAAELLRQRGKLPVASFKEFMKLATLEEAPSQAWTTDEAVKGTLDDVKTLREQALAIRKECADADFTIANFMEDKVTVYDKHIWFMESMLK